MPRKLLSRAQSSIKPKERKAAIEESAGRQTKAEPEGRCPSCRHELPEGSTFCPSCGAHLASHEPSKKESRRKRKKRAEVEAKRIGGTAALSCANELAGFELMYRSGLCESAKGVFSFTLEFSDISYEHERKDVKDDIFCKLCELHSIFGPGTVYQMNLLNLPNARYDAERYLPEEGADAKWASAYNDLLEERQKKGRVEFERRNLLTIAVTASDDEEAKRKLGSMAESATLPCRGCAPRPVALTAPSGCGSCTRCSGALASPTPSSGPSSRAQAFEQLTSWRRHGRRMGPTTAPCERR